MDSKYVATRMWAKEDNQEVRTILALGWAQRNHEKYAATPLGGGRWKQVMEEELLHEQAI